MRERQPWKESLLRESTNTVMVCRKLFAQPLDPAGFIDKECDTKWYPQKDYHTMYVVEIEKVLVD